MENINEFMFSEFAQIDCALGGWRMKTQKKRRVEVALDGGESRAKKRLQ